MLGLAPSKNDRELIELVGNSYKDVQVVGRGTVKINPAEVSSSKEFKAARARAKQIVIGRQ